MQILVRKKNVQVDLESPMGPVTKLVSFYWISSLFFLFSFPLPHRWKKTNEKYERRPRWLFYLL